MANSEIESFQDFHDLAFVLTEQFNNYAGATEQIELLEEEYVANSLRNGFDPVDVELLMDDEFGRGVLIGMIYMICCFESMANEDEE